MSAPDVAGPTREGPLSRWLVRRTAHGTVDVIHFPLAGDDTYYTMAIVGSHGEGLDMVYRIERYMNGERRP